MRARLGPHGIAHGVRRALLGVLVSTTLGSAACREEAKAPPPEPPKCAQFTKGTDTLVGEVLCAGQDGDGDGVDDAVDQCPTTAETKNGTLDRDGCPDPDADDDGLPDYEDGCPQEAGPPPDGCAVGDQDHDGLADHLDACPAQPEDIDGEDDSDGCPEGEHRLSGSERLASRARVEIGVVRGGAVPTADGGRALAAVVDRAALEGAAVVRIDITALAGLKEAKRGRARPLAEERAALVRDAFLRAGIPPSRLRLFVEPLRGDDASRTGGIVVELFGVEAAAAVDGGVASAAPPPSPPADAGAPATSTEPAGPTPAPVSNVDDDEWDLEAMGGTR